MSILNRLPEFTVKISNGSGCLFQPKSSDYAYILTAKHVLESGKSLLIERHLLNSKQEIEVQTLEIIGDPYRHNDPNKDAAIIKVKPVHGLWDLIGIRDPFQLFNECYLVGYPDSREKIAASFRENKISKILRIKNYGYIEADLEKIASHSEVKGQSGGGIIGINNNKYFLIGIQKQMSADDEQESLGRIDFMPLSFYEEIINQFPCDLKEIEFFTENKERLANSIEERNISIGGNVSQSNLHTGDINISLNLSTQDLTNPITLNLITPDISLLSSELSREKAGKLEQLREQFREGDLQEAYIGVQELRKSENWNNFEKPLQASTLRALASMTLAVNGIAGIDEAKKIANEAKQIDETQDDYVLRARIKIYEKGFQAAIGDFGNFNNTESYNLWLNCLLNIGKFEEVLESRRNPPGEINLNAETHRFYALALLASKNIDEAEKEIVKAKSEKPKWQYIRFTSAIIDYYSALSPSALFPYLSPFPKPIFPDWVRIDDKSQQKLSNAASEFQRLSEQFKDGSREQKECRTWNFACLANSINKQNEIAEIGKNLLDKDPTNLQILSWFLFRGYDYDYEKSLKLLEQNEREDEISIEDLLTLIGIYLKFGKSKEALTLIDKREEKFTLVGEGNLWRYWRGQALISNGQIDDALAEETEITDTELKKLLKTNILYYQGENLNNWKPLIKFLEESYKDNNSDSFLSLYEIKEIKARDEKFIFENAELYCELMQTASAVNFVVKALWNINRPEKCLDLLTKYTPLFPKENLPSHLRRLKIHCLIESNIKAALKEAESLANDDNNVENIALLMDVHLVRGDLTGIQVVAKKLLQRTDVSAVDLLRAAQLVQIKDSKLAIKFWMRAIEVGISNDPELIAFANNIASKLGLEDQSRDLMRQMMQQAHEGKGPMKMMSFRQMLKLMEKRSKAFNEIDKKYGAGEMPLHILSQQKNISLALIFNRIADNNKERADLHNSPRLFIRHGARILYPAGNFVNSKNWNIHLDITSLLLAHKIGILDNLEKLYKPLKISRHTVTALIEQRDDLRPHQKSQLDGSKIVVDLYNRNKLKVLSKEPSEESLVKIHNLVKINSDKTKGKKGLEKNRIIIAKTEKLKQQLGDRLNTIAHSISESGFAVGLLPINCYGTKDYAILQMPDEINSYIINCRAIVDSLKGKNRISEEKYNQVIVSLGTEGKPLSTTSPLTNEKLFFMSGVEDVLARSGLLEIVCENFEVIISQAEFDDAKNTIQYYKELDELGNSLEELINRITEGIDERIYEFILISDEKTKKEKRSKKFSQGIESTLDLLLFNPKERDVISLDDRSLTKHPTRQENQVIVPCISINELLTALRQNGEIDNQKYYNLLLDLRKSNFRYIPIDEDEIIFHLKRASIKNGRIVETEALSILRQYHASCLLDKEFLQILDSNQFSEVPFITQGVEAISDTIVKLWNEDIINIEIPIAQSDWILETLYTGNFGCLHLRNQTALEENLFKDVDILVADIINLLMKGFIINDNSAVPQNEQSRAKYLDWLEDRLLTTYCVASPEILKAIANEIESRFKIIYNREYKSPEEKFFAGYFMGRFFLDLPKILDKEIRFDTAMNKWLQIRATEVVNVSELNFEADEYWKAIEKTLKKKQIAVKTIDLDTEYVFTLEKNIKEEDDNLFPTIKISDLNGEKVAMVKDPSFGVLAESKKTRINAIYKLRSWFDCNLEDFRKIANEIASIKNPINRVSQFFKIRQRSIVFFYDELEHKYRKKEIKTWQELMPPSAINFAGYFYLPPSIGNKTFPEIWQIAANEILKEEDVFLAISRFSILPISMPKEIIERFFQLPDEEKIILFEKLTQNWASPLQLLHLANLAMRSVNIETDAFFEISKNLLTRLFKSGNAKSDFESFQAVLNFVKNEIGYWREIMTFSPEIKLALIWGHASRLYQIQRAIGLMPEDIIQHLSNRNHNFFESLNREPRIWNDCSYPNRISHTKFLSHVAANLFQGINETVLESLDVIEMIKENVFQKSDGFFLPKIDLMMDPMLCEDKLQSLFGGDRFDVLSQIIDSDLVKPLKSESLKQDLKTYLEEIVRNPQKMRNWIIVHLIVNNLPIYEELKELCLKGLKSFTIDSLFQKEEQIDNPSFIVQIAANQMQNFDDKILRKSFRKYILEMLRMKLIQDKYADNLEVKASLIDAVLALSYFLNDPVKSNKEFVSLIEEISDHWKDLKKYFGYEFSKNVWNVPPKLSTIWWHLALEMRTGVEHL